MSRVSKEEIISVQDTQLAEWKDKLNDKVYNDLFEWAKKGNDVFDDHYDIRRGTDLNNFVLNWTPNS